MGRINCILLALLGLLLSHCSPEPSNLGNELEQLRIQSVRTSDAYHNLIEFNQTVEEWNTLQGKQKADSFFWKLCRDYQLTLSEEASPQTLPLLIQDSLYLEVASPLFKNQKIEIPAVNFHQQDQTVEVQARIVYLQHFKLTDFTKRKKEIIGKILAIQLNPKDFNAYIEASKNAGVLGLIFIIEQGNAVPCYQYPGHYKIPLIGLAQDEGFFLIESLEKYPKQFIRIYAKRKWGSLPAKKRIWTQNFGQARNLYVISSWKSNTCNKSLLYSVAPSFILMDVAKTFQNLEWESRYNLVFVWTENEEEALPLQPQDLVIRLNPLTDWLGWNYPASQAPLWKWLKPKLQVYENRLIMTPTNAPSAQPIIPPEHQNILHTDLENTEWIHADMITRSVGMVALSLYLITRYPK